MPTRQTGLLNIPPLSIPPFPPETGLIHQAGHRLKPVRPMLRSLFRRLDHYLLGKQKIREFSTKEECLLRLSVRECPRPMQLADGTSIASGEPVGEFHWWNEHIPVMKNGRPDLRWARDFQRHLRITLEELAAHIEQDPAWMGVKGFRGDNSFGGREGQITIPALFRRWGFELVAAERPTSLRARFVSFWEGVYLLLMIWTYSSTALDKRSIREMKSGEIWISREVLLAKYGPQAN